VESLGEKLRATREGKGISLDQAGLDTKIAIRHLEALENENFSIFPGETYITGFIRNYGSYLDLDAAELFAMYKAIKIQEQPIPMEQLMRRPSALPKIAIIALAALLLAGAAAAAFWFLPTRAADSGGEAPAARIPVEFVMSGSSFEHRFFAGDSLLVFPEFEFDADESERRLKLLGVSGGEVIVQTPAGPVALDAQRVAVVDFESTGLLDLLVSALDYDGSDPEAGALLRFELLEAQADAPPGEPDAPAFQTFPASAAPARPFSAVVLSSPNPHPFTFQASFQGGSMFRWEVLAEPARRERDERFFQRLDELTVANVHNGVRIWTSNAQAARFQVIGGGRTVPIEIGGAGEVVVADIRWVRGEDNVFRIIVSRLEA
jgi:transcriptional regulator with XRE-family HTH domain